MFTLTQNLQLSQSVTLDYQDGLMVKGLFLRTLMHQILVVAANPFQSKEK